MIRWAEERRLKVSTYVIAAGAREHGRSSRNKAEYEVQRRHMMQEWLDIGDAWVAGEKHTPVLIPPSMPLLALDPSL